MESYRELRDRQQKEFNELPLGFAFSDKQFDEMMGKWGLDPEKDLDKIYRIPGGGFIQKKDHKHFHEVLDRHNAEMEAAKAADEMEQDFFTRCSSTNWIITSTDILEILKILWIAWG